MVNTMLKEIHDSRIEEEYNYRNSIDYIADIEYIDYCIWCRVKFPIFIADTNKYAVNEMKEKRFKNIKLFREYLKSEKKTFNRHIPDFWIKKKIAEKYFGYKYVFNNQNNRWKASKECV